LSTLGFRQPQAMLERLQSFRQSGRYLQLPASNRERLDALGPRLIDAAAATGNALTRPGSAASISSIRSAGAAPIWPCCSSIRRR
jgi:glutamate-ammonia-ligase adenylyltransferase